MRTSVVTLGDGRALTIHEPTRKALPLVLRIMPSLDNLRKIFSGEALDIPDADLDLIDALLANMTDTTAGEVNALSMSDWMALLMAFSQVMPKDFLAQPTIASSSSTPLAQ